jgi:hypothetical protein
MDLRTIASLAKEYRDMGDMVTDQLNEFLDDDGANVNANAVRMHRTWIKSVQRAAAQAQDTELVEDCADQLDLIEHYLS